MAAVAPALDGLVALRHGGVALPARCSELVGDPLELLAQPFHRLVGLSPRLAGLPELVERPAIRRLLGPQAFVRVVAVGGPGGARWSESSALARSSSARVAASSRSAADGLFRALPSPSGGATSTVRSAPTASSALATGPVCLVPVECRLPLLAVGGRPRLVIETCEHPVPAAVGLDLERGAQEPATAHAEPAPGDLQPVARGGEAVDLERDFRLGGGHGPAIPILPTDNRP